ncbi:MAG: EAL domain-containing protein [Rhodanobacter sp.]|nr:EAL domain-containing protein [Rhodanobacter sp.]
MLESPALAITWSAELSVGNDVIDGQHERLIELFNELVAIQSRGITQEELQPVLDDLLDYTRYHFRTEADLMREWRVDATHREAHLKAHHGFISFLQRVQPLAPERMAESVEYTILFLSQWLLHHIMGMDVRLAREIRIRQEGSGTSEETGKERAIEDQLVLVISDLYNRIGDRTFEVQALNARLHAEIEERQRISDGLQRLERLHRALVMASDMFLSVQSEAEAFEVICSRLVESELFVAACVLQPLDAEAVLSLAAAGPGDVVTICRALLLETDSHASVSGVWRDRYTTCVNESELRSEPTPRVQQFLDAGLRAWSAVPIERENSPFAALVVASSIPDCFDTATILLMVQIGGLLRRTLEQINHKQALEQARQEQSVLARHDALTGLMNRMGLLEQLPRALARARRAGTTLALGVIDLDDFKPVNDAWGHPAGDVLLAEFGRRLAAALREQDMVARLGGDEFVVVIEDLEGDQPLAQLQHTLDRLHQAVETSFELSPTVNTSVGMSMGVALFPDDGEEVDGLLRTADIALYQAKAMNTRRPNWWYHGTGPMLETSQHETEELIEDPYAAEAAALLEMASGYIQDMSTQFIEVFYENLAIDPAATLVLDQLSTAQRQSLKDRQADHLRFLLDPGSTREMIVERARYLGALHALVGVANSQLLKSFSIYRTLFTQYLSQAPLRTRNRYRLLLLAESRLEQDIQTQFNTHEALLEHYQSTVRQPLPALGLPWVDAIMAELTVLGALQGITAAILMRPNPDGTFLAEGYAGSQGQMVASILNDPATCVLVDATAPRGQGLTAQAWRSGQTLSSTSYLTDPRYQAWHALAAPLKFRSAISIPVFDRHGHTVAVLSLYGAYPNQFESNWIKQFFHDLQQRWHDIWQRCHAPAAYVHSPAVAQNYRVRLFDGGLAMYMQPIIDLRSGKVVKVEALARLRLADGTVQLPDRFLPLLGDVERLRLFHLGLEQVLAQLASWDAQGLSLNAAINLEPSTLHSPGIEQHIADALHRHGIAPERLSLELLESGNLDDRTQDEAFRRITQLGISLEMDDLGAGFSSLQRFAALPFASTKIDRSLVARLRQEPIQTFSLIAALVALGRDLQRPVVVEGLEDASMVEVATMLGASCGQGYALARPMPAEAVAQWISSFRLPVEAGAIHTFRGALACLWQNARSAAAARAPAASACPLGEFFRDHGLQDSEGAALHARMQTDPDPADASTRLMHWLADNITSTNQ